MTTLQKAVVVTVCLNIAIAIGWCSIDRQTPEPPNAEERRSQETLLANILQLHRSAVGRVRDARGELAKADGTIAVLEQHVAQKRAPVLKNIATIEKGDSVPMALESVNVTPGDTTMFTRIRRKGIDQRDYVVPLFMWDAWQNAVQWAFYMDTLVVQYKDRDAKAGVLIAAMDQQLMIDSSAMALMRLRIASQDTEIKWWQKHYRPRCGRKCGIAIGVGGTVVAAFAIREVQTVLSRDHSSTVYPLPYRAP